MTFRRDILRFWAIFCAILVLALGAITLVHRWHRIFPSGEVSEIYMKYAEREDIDASFVKNYRVGDTVFVDVTLLQAKDSCSWEQLCEDFGIAPLSLYPKEYIELMTLEHSFDQRIVADTLISKGDGVFVKKLIVFSHLSRTMCIFHNIDDTQYDAIINQKYKEITF